MPVIGKLEKSQAAASAAARARWEPHGPVTTLALFAERIEAPKAGQFVKSRVVQERGVVRVGVRIHADHDPRAGAGHARPSPPLGRSSGAPGQNTDQARVASRFDTDRALLGSSLEEIRISAASGVAHQGYAAMCTWLSPSRIGVRGWGA
jgi:hypothetical protein